MQKKKALNLLLALNSNMGRTNLTRVENVNSLFVTKWNKIIWIDTYALINLTCTSIITILPWDFSLSLGCWKLLSLGAGIWQSPASLTQFGFYRESYLLADRTTHPTGHSLCSQLPAYFCQHSAPKVCLQGLSLGVCSAEAIQGFIAAPFSAFFRGSLLSLSSNYSSINQSFSLSVFYVKFQEILLGYNQLDKSHVSGTACCYVSYCVIEKKPNDYLHVFRNMVAILTHTSMHAYLS